MSVLKIKLWALMTVLVMAITGAAWAHGGATGVVKERMDAMSDMAKAVKKLTPMFRGRTRYNPDMVRTQAQRLEDQAGQHMTRLFPEGSQTGPSEAKDTIWEDWAAFERAAEDLARSARALAETADKVVLSDAGKLVMPSKASALLSSATKENSEAESKSPVQLAFEQVKESCLACHQTFRETRR